MRVDILRDRFGRTLGEIVTTRDGLQVGRDRSGRRVGEYDPVANVTRDAGGQYIGDGNLLASLMTPTRF